MAESIRIEELMERQAEKLTKLEFEARKVYLENYISIVRRMEEARRELEEAEMDIGPGAFAATGMPRSSKVSDGSGRIINRMENISRLKACIQREIRMMERQRDEIGRVIDDMPQGNLQEVLYYRYVRDMDIGEIADKMRYCYRQVQNIHARAVSRIKAPRNAIARIKKELFEEHPEWADIVQKIA